MAKLCEQLVVLGVALVIGVSSVNAAAVHDNTTSGVIGEWSTWSYGWSTCLSSCKQTRNRTCIASDNCIGSPREKQSCTGDNCIIDGGWTLWSSYSECFVDCWQSRTRTCTNPKPHNGGEQCIGDAEEIRYPCTGGDCKDDCVDTSPNCLLNKHQCDKNQETQRKCKKTCELCDGTSG